MSSSTDTPGIKVARLGRPHGLGGFLGLYVDTPDLVHFEPGARVMVGDTELTVRAVRKADRGYHVAFEEARDRNSAELIRGRDVMVAERRPLEEGEFWTEDLVGLEVRPGGGRVVTVVHGPAQDRLVVERDGAQFEVPFVEPLVPTVDLAEGYVEIVEVDGLIPPSSE